jgi:phosphatidylserine/phosphatidylglycerophosphate/cardiolipin synthase-like enzyme
VGGQRPKRGNSLDVFVDGAEALPQIAAAVDSARSSVWLAGWFFSPEFNLRPDRSQTLRELFAEAAERVDVRVLPWAGAPLPFFDPDRKDVRTVREALTRGTRSGEDLRATSRRRVHDPGVLRESSPFGAAADLSREPVSLVARDRLGSRRQAPQPAPRQVPLLALLPARPNNGNDDTRGQLGRLADADGDADRFLACTLSQHGSGTARPVYVHAKIGIVDDAWLTLGPRISTNTPSSTTPR